MRDVTIQYTCQNCGAARDGSTNQCQNCGHSEKIISIGLNDTIFLRDDLNLKKFVPDKRKFAVEVKKGWSPSGNMDKHPEGVYRTQVIDRENNLYTKKVEDAKTGDILKDLQEPLSDHK